MSSKYSFSVTVKNFWLLVVPIAILLFVVGSIVGFILVDNVIMPRFTDVQNRNDVVVPSVVGLDAEAAAQVAFDLGLRTTRPQNLREFSDEAPVNTVIRQEPQEGITVTRGRHIALALSRGPEVAEIPGITGLLEGPSRTELRRAGFDHLSSRQVFNDTVPLNATIETYPPAGTRTSREAPIVIITSRGPAPTHASVPNVVGDMLSSARSRITGSGLRVGRIEYRASNVMSAGQIISQSLTPGTSVLLNTTVDLIVVTE